MSIGRAIRAAREAAGWSQDRLAAELQVAQGTVSAWELELQSPLAKHRRQLAAKLKLTDKQLAPKTKAQGRSRVLALTDYLRQQQDYLESYPEDHGAISICFIGPENLPVLDSPEVQDVWVENLLRGTNYVVLWFLCMVEEGALRELSPKLASIGRRVQKAATGAKSKSKPGTIRHYGVRLLESFEEDPVFDSNQRDFQQWMNEKIPCNEFFFNPSPGNLKAPLRRRLLRHYVAHGSIAVYHHDAISHEPFAGLTLEAVRTTIAGTERRAYFFLGAEYCRDLVAALTDFFALAADWPPNPPTNNPEAS